jgi:hypothetical protein
MALRVALNHKVVGGRFFAIGHQSYASKNPPSRRQSLTLHHSLFLPFLFFIDSRKRKLSLFISKI